jgi:hypothetical protein
VGLAALGGAWAVAVACLPFRITSLPPPWHCSDPAFRVLLYLAFPANVLTNDLALAVYFAPLSLLIYAILGALVGRWLGLRSKIR